MRYAKPFALLALAAPLVSTAPAWGRVSPEWTKALAEVQALPQDGSLPPQVLAEVRQKITPAANAPTSFAIVGLDVSGNFSEETWSRRPDGLWGADVIHFTGEDHHVLDPLGILDLKDYLAQRDHDGGPETVTTLSFSAPIFTPGTVSALVQEHLVRKNVSYNISVIDKTLELRGTADGALMVSGLIMDRHIGDDKGVTGEPRERVADEFRFDPRFGVFLGHSSAQGWDGQTGSLFDSEVAKLVADGRIKTLWHWRIDDGKWRSQEASAAVSPAQREQAWGLFARGFDLYKAGDLVGAKALILGGLKIDPDNHLGWFALGELGRSIVANGSGNTIWADAASRVGYRHTIDLAPDSPEALLAKSYLETKP